jgi:hypothetical protein
LDYLGKRQGTLPHKQEILNDFKSVQEYGEYVKIVITECREIREKDEVYFIE